MDIAPVPLNDKQLYLYFLLNRSALMLFLRVVYVFINQGKVLKIGELVYIHEKFKTFLCAKIWFSLYGTTDRKPHITVALSEV